ncbi:hypothetical protein ACFRAQ_25490 [Nocardia sp. NPDC056611]|uniref:hypothetical protein n=1 Tax=Nocardia sp. NPDC056611 TaxID=3345877 RepID=UPI00366C799E
MTLPSSRRVVAEGGIAVVAVGDQVQVVYAWFCESKAASKDFIGVLGVDSEPQGVSSATRTLMPRPARFSDASEQPITRRRRCRRSRQVVALLVVDDILNRIDLVLDHLGARHQLDPVGLGEALGTELLENAGEG